MLSVSLLLTNVFFAQEINKSSKVNQAFNPTTTEFYVDPTNGNDGNSGTYASPYKTIPFALDKASDTSTPIVYVKSGTYNYTSSINITTNSATPIVLKPETGGFVKFNFQSFKNFNIVGARNIEFSGFEINGQSNVLDHWTLLSEYVWLPDTLTDALKGGGMAFQIQSGNDIKITNNYIHDFYQKAINIEDGRYVTIQGNIITNIAKTSLSGGHGIMRQQGSGSFAGNDDTTKYRWDLNGNLLFNVHQRIYSWVPRKGYLNMTLDEGKAILIDETPNHDQGIKARIQNNIVAFSRIDAIRLKPTNNLEVRNNSVYTNESHGDGITDTTTGYNQGSFGPPFVNFQCFNNLVQVNTAQLSYELAETIGSTGATYGSNYSGVGTISPSNVATNLNTNVFVNANAGNFTPTASVPANIGANVATRTDLTNRATQFGVTIANDFWVHNHLKNTQTLIDNIPGIEDGVINNESVFTDAGVYDLSDLEYANGRKSYYHTVNTTWKSVNNVTNSVLNHGNGLDVHDGKYELVTPEEYSTWYDNIKATYRRDSDNNGSDDSPYDRIRYGESIIKQNKIFLNNSLHVVEINSASNYNTSVATGKTITLDGDILFNFNYTPAGNEVFDVFTAGTINTANVSNLFDRVRFVGYTGTYTLTVITGSPNILRLRLTNTLSTAQFKLNSVKLYPNPSNNAEGFNLSIEDNTSVVVKIFNSLGQEIPVTTKHSVSNIYCKSNYNLASGLYFVEVSQAGASKKLKYIVN